MYARTTRFLIVALLATAMAACGATDDPDESGNNSNHTTNNNTNNGNNTDPGSSDMPGEVVESALSRETDPAVDPADFEQFSSDNREFAFAMLDELRGLEGDDANIFLSPHSISVALAMTYGGAVNNTKQEMSDALRFRLDDADLHPAFNLLDHELASRADVDTDEGNEAFELDIINQTWGHHDFDFEADYLDLLAVHYGAAMSVVDFVSDFDDVRVKINQWVEAQTEERIQDLLPENSLDDATRFVLVNAIYFYGSWAEPFDDNLTSDQPFARLDGTTVDVPMMKQDTGWETFDDGDTVAVSLPYVGDEVSMIALMPSDETDDFVQWEDQFDRQAFDDVVAGLSGGRAVLHFPRFESDGAFKLKDAFEAMGMFEPFEVRGADFEGITGHPPGIDGKSLYIDEIFHKTYVKIDEEGTEAAAATGVVGGTPTSVPPEIHFNRPFRYAVYDHGTDTILFLGRMVDPS